MISIVLFSTLFAALVNAQDTAMVRAVHGVAGAIVDIYIDPAATNPQPTIPGFVFNTVTDFLVLPAGQHTIEARAANASTVIATVTTTLTAGHRYSVAAAPDAAGTPKFYLADEGFYVPEKKAQLLVWHLSATAPAISVKSGTNTFPSGSDGLAFGSLLTVTAEAAAVSTFDVVVASDNSPVLTGVSAGLQDGFSRIYIVLGDVSKGVASPATNANDGGKLFVSVQDFMFGRVGVAFAHLFPADLPVDIWYAPMPSDAPKVKVVGDVPFGTVSDFFMVPYVDLNLWVAVAGSTTEFVLAKVPFPLDKTSTRKTVAVVPNDDGTPTAVVIEEGKPSDVYPTSNRITLAHLLYNAPAVSVVRKGTKTPVLIDSMPFKAFKTFQLSGSDTDAEFDILNAATGDKLDTISVSRAAGSEQLLVVTGNLTSTDATYGGLQYKKRENGVGRVSAFHGVESAGAVDVALGNIVYGQINFGQSTGEITLASSTSQRFAAVAGSSDFSGTKPLPADGFLTVIPWGAAFSGSSILVAETTSQAPAPGKAHIRVAHLAANVASAVAIKLNGTEAFPSVAQGTITNYAPIDAGYYSIEATIGSTVVLSVPSAFIEAGKAYSAYATGDSATMATPVLVEDKVTVASLASTPELLDYDAIVVPTTTAGSATPTATQAATTTAAAGTGTGTGTGTGNETGTNTAGQFCEEGETSAPTEKCVEQCESSDLIKVCSCEEITCVDGATNTDGSSAATMAINAVFVVISMVVMILI